MHNEVWSFLETDGDRLSPTATAMAAEAKRTAKIFKAHAAGVIFSNDPSGVIEALHPYGLEKIYCYRENLPLAPEIISQCIQVSAGEASPQFILFADTPLGADIGARVATGLRRGFISPCTDFSNDVKNPVARKSIYAGKADALITWTTPAPFIAGVALEALETTTTAGSLRPEIIEKDLPAAPPHSELKDSWAVDLSQLDLSEAKIVIGVGKGVSPDQMPLVENLAGRIKGVIGGTRIAVYDGLIPHARQIGTTGKWLNCDLYFALGISGAPQHVMGIKAVKKIIAINIAKEATIFKHAQLGIVNDWKEVIQQLVALLETEQGGEA